MKITDILTGALFVALIIPMAATIVPTGSVHFMTVSGTSMEPTITSSDIIVVIPEAMPPSVGDIISYRHQLEDNQPPMVITHRIVRLEEGGYRTKGDSVPKRDGYVVAPEDVIGVLHLKIPYIGALTHFAKTSAGSFFLVIVPAFLLIIDEVRKILCI